MNQVVLEMEGISKRFGATRALNGVKLTVRSHEIQALMGENGAGKSTLMKIISGRVVPDSGEINFTKEKYTDLNKKFRKDPSSYINFTGGPISGGPRASFQMDPKQIQEVQKRMEAEIKSQNNPIELYK